MPTLTFLRSVLQFLNVVFGINNFMIYFYVMECIHYLQCFSFIPNHYLFAYHLHLSSSNHFQEVCSLDEEILLSYEENA